MSHKLLDSDKYNRETKYNLLFESCQEMLLFINYRGIIADANQVAKDELGYSSDLIGMNITEIFKEFVDSQTPLSDILKANRKVKRGFETIAYRKDKTHLPVNVHISIHGNDNDLIGLCTLINLSLSEDIKRLLSNAKNDIDEANKIKNEFAANVTHELRTPVNGIMGLAKILLETDLNKMQKDTVIIINKCCDNMSKNIDDLLDFSKLAAGKLTIDIHEFDFKQFIHNVLEINKNQIYSKGLKLVLNIDKEIPDRLMGDEHRLTQIINNLISNAVKFTSVGYISINISKIMNLGNEIELFFMVIDTGIGIDESDQDKLFHSFSQVDGSITRRFGGTGLGLAICKKLIELMDGNISVNSEKGKGSIFSFVVRLGLVNGDENLDEDYCYYYDNNYANNNNYVNNNNYINGNNYVNDSNTDIGNWCDKDNSLNDNSADKKEQINLENGITKKLEIVKQTTTEGTIYDIIMLLDGLCFCVEMGNWDKADSIAGAIKNHIGEDDKERKKEAFRVELAVRKEDYNKSLQHISQLKQMFDEV